MEDKKIKRTKGECDIVDEEAEVAVAAEDEPMIGAAKVGVMVVVVTTSEEVEEELDTSHFSSFPNLNRGTSRLSRRKVSSPERPRIKK